MWSLIVSALTTIFMVVITIRVVKSRNMQYWLPSYIRHSLSARQYKHIPIDTTVYVCFADHYEPYGGGTDTARARQKVAEWAEIYPKLALLHQDSFGNHPKHSFFYPIEEYDPQILDQLAELEHRGYAGVEVHYHHHDDNAENLTSAIRNYTNTLHQRHGVLRLDGGTEPAYCFIHGNWALDNSRPDGKWCGVDNELTVLVKTGCRVDYTMPSAPSDTQTSKINSIYAARGVEGKRKSHDTGRDIEVGKWLLQGEILLVQGPLALNWERRKAGIMPRIENSEISSDCPPSPERVPLWLKYAPRIKGAEQHIFIKLHTHGAEDQTMNMLLNGGFEMLWKNLKSEVCTQNGHKLRYVTAWEMFTTIRDLSLMSKTN
jgi:hypothetical protein